jgi:hypothetical protein
MPKLTISRLRKIIAEEVSLLREGEKEDQAASMAQNASKLLKAIESFKSTASSKAKSSADASNATLEKHLLEAEKMLKRIVASPLNYVDGPKQPIAGTPSAVVPDQSLAGAATTKKVSVKPAVEKK